MLAGVPEAVESARGLGLGALLVGPRTTQAAVALPEGRHPLPAGTVQGVPTSAEGLDGVLTPAGVARVRAEAELPPLRLAGDVSVGALLRERLGDEVVDRLVEPLLGGVYAGRPDDLSLAATMPALAAQLRTAPSVLAGAIAARDAGARSRGDVDGPVFVTVRDGIGSLPDALVRGSGADVRLGTAATALRRSGRGFELDVADGETLTADAVVLATPAGPTARLLADLAPDAVDPLHCIP